MLKFICPKCGGKKLVSVERTTELYPLTITEDGQFEYGDAVKANGISDGVDHHACQDCGYTIYATEPEKLVAWLEANCKQE